MSRWIADYELLEQVGPAVHRVRPPARLGLDHAPVALRWVPTESVAPGAGDPALAALVSHLRQVAAVTSAAVVRPLEAGPGLGGAWFTAVWPSWDLLDPSASDALALVAGAADGADALHRAGLTHGVIGVGSVVRSGPGGCLLPAPPPDPVSGVVATIEQPAELDTLAPEVVRGEMPTPASDVWALGALLHRVATGRLLHPELATDTLLVATARVADGRMTPDPSLSGELGDLIRHCLTEDPDRRPVEPGAVTDRLAALAGRA